MIKRLSAGPRGAKTNSDGRDVADAVNGLVDANSQVLDTVPVRYAQSQADEYVLNEQGQTLQANWLPYIAPDYRTRVNELFPDAKGVNDRYFELQGIHQDCMASSQIGADDLGNPIYQFTITSGNLSGDYAGRNDIKPHLVIITGTHGFEKMATTVTYLTVKEMLNGWKADKDMALLHWCSKITIIPCLNPSSFNLNQRAKHNGVDINRNFPTGWDEVPAADPGPWSSYKGPSPASEPETQALISFIDTLTNPVVMDFHNHGSFENDKFAYWVGLPPSSDLLPAVAKHLLLADGMPRRFIDEYGDGTAANYSRITTSSNGTITRHMGVNNDALLYEQPYGYTLSERPSNPDISLDIVERDRFDCVGQFKRLLVDLVEYKYHG